MRGANGGRVGVRFMFGPRWWLAIMARAILETPMRRLILLSAALCALATAADAKTSAPTLQDRQQAACADDAQRLCGDVMPDVDKVTACMKTKKASVSKKCAAMYKATE